MSTEFQPYVGPRPFERTKADQDRFFGRMHEAAELLSRITAHSAVLFYSQSGAGKTSLINARLSPMLEKAGFDVLRPARVRDVSSDEAIYQQIQNVYVFNALRSWNFGETDAARLAGLSLPVFLAEHGTAPSEERDGIPRVAIFDQFEEMFTSYQDRLADREDFFEQIAIALEEDRLLRVVFAMREEYIAELDPYLPLLREKLRTRFRLERLNEDDALLAITEPLKDTEYSYADGVAGQLVEDLLTVPVETASGVVRVRGESVEPVQLQVACQTLWENCQESWRKLGLKPDDKKVITHEYLVTFGDVDQALSTFYESAITRVVHATGVKEGVLRRWFEQSLITSAGTRGTVYHGARETGGILNEAVEQLVNQHLIRGEVRGGGSRWYELTHDRLIPPIKVSNERWLLEHSGGEQTPKRLEVRAEQWVRDGRKKQDLLDEGELLEARRWLDSPGASDVGYSEMLFAIVQASRAASEEAARGREQIIAAVQAKSARRLRWLTAALAVMVFCSAGALVFAWRKQAEAVSQATEAAKQEQAAADARTKLTDEKLARANEAAQAAAERVKELKDINEKLDYQRKRAIRESGIAKTNETRAVKAEKELRVYTEVENQLDAKRRELVTLFLNARNMPIEEGKVLLTRALELCEEVLTGYRAIGQDTDEVLELRNRIKKELLRADRTSAN